MAEFSTNPRTARVDMTPMVDLGFLLITFFMFTTNFSKPNAMFLALPSNEGKTSSIDNENTITLIAGKENKLLWHQEPINNLKASDLKEVFYGQELRNLILQKRKFAKNTENFTVIIHPTDECNYKNVVDILDEMTITNQKRFALADIFPKEKEVYSQLTLK